jgi:hypothetical protein
MALTKVSYSMIEGATLNVLDFGADPTGVADSAPAFQAALAAIPSTGGVITVPDGAAYKLDSTIIVTKEVMIDIGSTVITGPASGYMFHFTVRYCGLRGNGKTVLKLSTPSNPVVSATATATLVGNSITSVTLSSGGSNYQSRPVCIVDGDDGDGAFIRPELTGGSYGTTVGTLTLTDGGQNYTNATVSFFGGGAGIIKTEGNNCVFRDFIMDMSSVPYAVGFHHWSGWYNDEKNITIIYGTDHPTAIFYLIESQPPGTVPYDGGTGGGSFAATYVSYWENIGAGRTMVMNATGVGPITTISGMNVDARRVIMHQVNNGTFIRFTVQDDGIPLVTIADCGTITFIGSHFEGKNLGDKYAICYNLCGQVGGISSYSGTYDSIAQSTPGKWYYYNSPKAMRSDCLFNDRALGIFLPQENFVEGYAGVRFSDIITGNLKIELSDVNGVLFPTAPLASANANALDFYEEGVWTPALRAASGTDVTVGYASRSGTFTRIGNLVTIRGTMTLNSFANGSQASAWIQLVGLPYTGAAGATQISRMTASGFSSTTTPSVLDIGTTVDNYMLINDSADARDVVSTKVIASDFSGDETITVTATYFV